MYILACNCKWLCVCVCVCAYLYIPRLKKTIKDKNLGVASQLTEMVATFSRTKRDVILNSVFWVWRRLMGGERQCYELTAPEGWQWVETNNDHDWRTAHHSRRHQRTDLICLRYGRSCHCVLRIQATFTHGKQGSCSDIFRRSTIT